MTQDPPYLWQFILYPHNVLAFFAPNQFAWLTVAATEPLGFGVMKRMGLVFLTECWERGQHGFILVTVTKSRSLSSKRI